MAINSQQRIITMRGLLPNPSLTCGSVQIIQEISDLINPILSQNNVAEFVLQIHQQNIKIHLCNLIYNQQKNNITLDLSLYLYILTELISTPGQTHTESLIIFDQLDYLFDQEMTEEADKLQIYDIMVTYYPIRSQRLHDILQNQNINRIQPQNRIIGRGGVADQQNRIPMNPQIHKNNIYNDSQNVHTTTINKSVLNACETLLKIYPPHIVCKKLYQHNPEKHGFLNRLTTIDENIYTKERIIKINWFISDTIETIKYKLSCLVNIHYDDIIIGVNEGYKDKYGNINYSWIKTNVLTPENNQTVKSGKNTEDGLSIVTGSARASAPKTNKIIEKTFIQEIRDFLNIEETPRAESHSPINIHKTTEHNIQETTYCANYNETCNEKKIVEKTFVQEICDLYFLKKSSDDIIIKKDFILSPKNITEIVFFYKNIRKTTCEEDINEIQNFITHVFQDLFHFNRFNNLQKRIRFSSVRDIKIYDILNCVWKLINFHLHKEELKIRLIEELKDADGMCSTGIMSRLINCFQGFITENLPTLQVKIDIKNEIIGKLSYIINTNAQKQNIDPICDPELFQELIKKIIRKEHKNISNEYETLKNGEVIHINWLIQIMEEVYKN